MKATILEERNNEIKKEFRKLESLKIYRVTHICDLIGKKFWVTPSVVMAVVFEKGKYKPKSQNDEKNQESEPA